MLPKPNKKDALEIVKRLQDKGYIAYWVGGCVRDMLRGVEPEDYDVVTNATPEEVKKLFRRTVAVGESFGVVLVVMHKVPYEVATFRRDDTYSDGRRPDKVFYSTPQEDALRRDFTVNGMFYDPVANKLYDYVGGQEDLKAGVIRTIGEPKARFSEDKLRLMRAARFASLLGFKIEEATARTIKQLAGDITVVSAERIRVELVKILTGPRPRMGMELLSEHGILKHILPEVEAMRGVRQPPEFHPEGDVWIHTMLMLEKMKPSPEVELAMAVLLHDVGKPLTYSESERIRFDGHAQVGAETALNIMRRLRFSKREQDLVESLVREHLKFMEVKKMRTSTLKRFMRIDRFDLHLELHRLDCLASHGNLDNYNFVKSKMAEFEALEKEEALRPPPLITGHDLIRLGLKPGPKFKEILEAVEDAQLENIVINRKEALKFVNDLLNKEK